MLGICTSFTQTEDSYKMSITTMSEPSNTNKDAKAIFDLFFFEDLRATFP